MSLHLKSIIFAVCISVGAFSTSIASEVETILDTAALKSLYEEILISDSPFSKEDLEISNFSSRPSSVKLPNGVVEYKPMLGTITGRLGHRTFTLAIIVDGQEVNKVRMSGKLHLYGDVVIATKHLKRNTLLSPDDFTILRKNITMLNADLVQDIDKIEGKKLKATLRPGSILFKSLLKTPKAIKRGDQVLILARSGRVNVTVNGVARSSGSVGDMIKVKNMMSRREVYARIINNDQVEVEF